MPIVILRNSNTGEVFCLQNPEEQLAFLKAQLPCLDVQYTSLHGCHHSIHAGGVEIGKNCNKDTAFYEAIRWLTSAKQELRTFDNVRAPLFCHDFGTREGLQRSIESACWLLSMLGKQLEVIDAIHGRADAAVG